MPPDEDNQNDRLLILDNEHHRVRRRGATAPRLRARSDQARHRVSRNVARRLSNDVPLRRRAWKKILFYPTRSGKPVGSGNRSRIVCFVRQHRSIR